MSSPQVISTKNNPENPFLKWLLGFQVEWSWPAGTQQKTLNFYLQDFNDANKWPPAFRDRAIKIFDSISSMIGVKFQQTDREDKSQIFIQFNNLDDLGFTPRAFEPGPQQEIILSYKFLDPDNNLDQNLFESILLHEVGHALGLVHPFGDNTIISPFSTAGIENTLYTVMSYNRSSMATSYMAYDIAALQYLYGKNMTTGAGNDTYFLDDTSGGAKCIWDAGGIDAIAYNGAYDCTIDLRAATLQGSLDIGRGVSRSSAPSGSLLTIANGVTIEMAVGGSGNDVLIGNEFNNSLSGNAGDDFIDGGTGNDTMRGGAGRDTFVIDSLNDVIMDATAEDAILIRKVSLWGIKSTAKILYDLSYEGGTFIFGGAWNDTLRGNFPGLTLIGQGGDDLYIVDSPLVFVVEKSGGGIDTVRTSFGTYTLEQNVENLEYAGSGPFTGIGNASDNILRGGAGNDILSGKAGSDTFYGGDGADTFYGGTGNDFFFVDDQNDSVVEAAGEGIDTVQTSLVSWTLSGDVENLIGTSASDLGKNFTFNGYGNDLDNILITVSNNTRSSSKLFGGAGRDSLVGSVGQDWLDGGTGADTMYGGAGADTFIIDSIGDVIVDFTGRDIAIVTNKAIRLANSGYNRVYYNLVATSGDMLNGDSYSDTLDGGAGNCTLIGRAGGDTYIVNVKNIQVIEEADQGIDRIVTSLGSYTLGQNLEILSFAGAGNFTGVGNDGNNSLSGNIGNDSLTGGLGNDTLRGNAGRDTLAGGKGDDVYYIDDVNDLVIETKGDGIDKVIVDLSLQPFVWKLSDNVENMSYEGSAKATLVGNAADNFIFDHSGASGNLLDGGAGNDTLVGRASTGTLLGGGGNDSLRGSGYMQYLLGGDGDDTLVAWGDEVLTGDQGADVFRFEPGSDVIKVYITDFDFSQDTLVVGKFFFDMMIGQSLASTSAYKSFEGDFGGGYGFIYIRPVAAGVFTSKNLQYFE